MINFCQQSPVRVRSSLVDFIKRLDIQVANLLDLGCGRGKFAVHIGREIESSRIFGVDVDIPKNVKYRGIEVLKHDLNETGIPLPDASFDLITAIEVLEHLRYPDNMLKEVYRLLTPGGFFVLTTPNLGSAVNRVLILLGYMPYFSEPSLKYSAGLLVREKKVSKPAGHLRLYNLKAVKELLRFYDFEIQKLQGTSVGFKNPFLRLVETIFSKKASLSTIIMVAARKPKK